MKKGEGSEEVYDGWEPSYNVLVERSHNRLSVGSDKYSVIESSSTEDDNNNDNSYLTLIDMTSPEPVVRSRPDIIRDLPGKSRGLVRSTSFLSQAVGSRRSRWCGGGGETGGHYCSAIQHTTDQTSHSNTFSFSFRPHPSRTRFMSGRASSAGRVVVCNCLFLLIINGVVSSNPNTGTTPSI